MTNMDSEETGGSAEVPLQNVPGGADGLPDYEERLTVSGVVELLGGFVTAKTIARWADKGEIPHEVTLGGHRRFRRSAALALRDQLFPPQDIQSPEA